MNLIVGDYFKQFGALFNITDRAMELINWLRSRTAVHLLVQAKQKAMTGKGTVVIHPAITRWTAHLLAFERLLHLKTSIHSVVLEDIAKAPADRIVFAGDQRTKEKARDVYQDTILDQTFWREVARYVHGLEIWTSY